MDERAKSIHQAIKLRVYLDTSIISALLDERTPERQAQTRDFWSRLTRYSVGTSELTRQEIDQTDDGKRKDGLQKHLAELDMYPVSEEAHTIAQHYVDRDVFTALNYNDALHIAAALTTRHDVVVSWNFKHMVNRVRRALVNQINVALGLPAIEIVSPPEL